MSKLEGVERENGKPAGSLRLDSVQILRAVAALIVVVAHALHEIEGIGVKTAEVYDRRLFFPWECGVDIFFVISGFIMVYINRGNFGRRDTSLKFLMLRSIRIVPPYWFFTALVVLMLLYNPRVFNTVGFDYKFILSSLAFFPYTPFSGPVSPILLSGWTLNYEMYFYVIFSIALLMSLSRAVKFLVLYFLVTVVTGLCFKDMPPCFAFWSSSIVLEFVSGCIIGYAFVLGFRLDARVSVFQFVVTVVIFTLLYNLGLIETLPRSVAYGIPASVMVGSVILCGAGLVDSKLTSGIVLLGDASYALYLSHPFSLRLLSLAWKGFGLDHALRPYAYPPIALLLSCAVALSFYLVLEDPFHRWLRSKIGGAQRPGRLGSVSATVAG